MTRREAWLSAAAVFVFALAVRVVAAPLVPFPVPEDTAYYFGVARNVVEGRGLVSDALWSYQTPPLVLPGRPAFEVWLPLPTLLMVPAMLVLGATYAAAQVVSVAAGALTAVLAWRLGADLAAERGLPPGRARTLAVGAGATAAVYPPLVLHSLLADSTAPFAAIAVAAALLMTRIARAPRGGRSADLLLIGLGLLLGLAALTRNEAAWLALAWAAIAWFTPSGAGRAERLRLIAVPAVVALLVFGPWAVRDWIEFGSPLPGQAVSNALSVTGFDIFAYNDPPTLARYLAVGPARLVEMRLEGLGHNLLTVLLLPGVPVGPIGLLALPWVVRSRALRPLLVVSAITFLVTSLLFPVATTWGTFLHAAGPVHVLLVLSALVALDRGIAAVGRVRGWTRPVAWLGPAVAIGIALPILVLTVVGIGGLARDTEALFAELDRRLAARSVPFGDRPVIADHPIWVAEANRVPALALPDEPIESVLELAGRFGADLLIVVKDDHGRWPAVLDSADPLAACFEEIDLGEPTRAGPGPAPDDPLGTLRAWQIGCPAVAGP